MTGRKKFLAVFLALTAVIMLFSSCKKDEDFTVNDVTVNGHDGQVISINQNSVFKLSYTRGDSFNPFFAQMLNNQTLMTLMFEPLFQLNNEFMPQPLLATSSTMEGVSITVPLRTAAKFSDGTALTASDVVYSFKLAKNAPAYSANLAGIAAVREAGASAVTVELSQPNVNAQQLLTFPVVKSGTADKDSDIPVGTGRFVLKQEGVSYRMTPNGFYSKTPVITQIELVNAGSEEKIENALRIGNISFIYNDLSKGSRTSSNAKSVAVPLNNLIYIGFNPGNFLGQSADLRKAVSYSISRQDIVDSTYHGFATAATSVFNPLWKAGGGAGFADVKTDARAAEMLLKNTGYGGAALKLLVNEENGYRRAAADLIAKQMNAQGFRVTVQALPYDTYKSYIEAGYYDLFLGEVRLTDDMNLNCFFTAGGSCAFSIDLAASKTAVAYEQYLKGESSLGDFMIAFKEEMPFVPVAYRKGVVSYTGQLKVEPKSAYGDVFYNIEEWTF